MKHIILCALLTMAASAMAQNSSRPTVARDRIAQNTQQEAPILKTLNQLQSEAAALITENEALKAEAEKAQTYKADLKKALNNNAFMVLSGPLNKKLIDHLQKTLSNLDAVDFADFMAEKATLFQAVNDYEEMYTEYIQFLNEIAQQEKDPIFYSEFKEKYPPLFKQLKYYKTYYGKPVHIPYLETLFKLTEKRINSINTANPDDLSDIIILAKGVEAGM